VQTSRLEPCPCGSGKRYKHCHGITDQLSSFDNQHPKISTTKLSGLIKVEQSGKPHRKIHGEVKPSLHTEIDGNKFVVVGNELHFGGRWKLFTDFLTPFLANSLAGC
jgi:hypothetical protein